MHHKDISELENVCSEDDFVKRQTPYLATIINKSIIDNLDLDIVHLGNLGLEIKLCYGNKLLKHCVITADCIVNYPVCNS